MEDSDLPPPAELLTSDFSSPDLSDWTVGDDGVTSAPSDWRVIDGELAQLSNLYGEPFTAANIAAYGSYLRYEGGYGWSDYRVSYTQRAGDDDALGLMFRVTDADNYYRFSWHRQLGYRRLVKVVDGVFTELAADNVAYVQGRDYQIEVRVQGDRLDLWIDGTPIFQVTDADQPSGTIAFYTWAMQGGYFDDLLVEELGDAPLDPEPSSVCETPCTLWSDATVPAILTDPDGSPVELGLKFRSEVDGFIRGIRFYKSPQADGTHIGSLWSSSGQLLAQATFTNETSSGWQRVDFSKPVPIRANTVYVASYHSDSGLYAVDEGYFASTYTNGPLSALADGPVGGNGVYRYGARGFPSNSYRSSNYWVDVVFTTQ